MMRRAEQPEGCAARSPEFGAVSSRRRSRPLSKAATKKSGAPAVRQQRTTSCSLAGFLLGRSVREVLHLVANFVDGFLGPFLDVCRAAIDLAFAFEVVVVGEVAGSFLGPAFEVVDLLVRHGGNSCGFGGREKHARAVSARNLPAHECPGCTKAGISPDAGYPPNASSTSDASGSASRRRHTRDTRLRVSRARCRTVRSACA